MVDQNRDGQIVMAEDATVMADTRGRHADAFPSHPLRQTVLNEIHARPFHVVRAPRVLLHYAFMTDAEAAEEAHAALAVRCRAWGVTPPAPGSRHHLVEI